MQTVVPLKEQEDRAAPVVELIGAPAEPWYVLHVKSRQEKALASDLERLGIWHFLPLVNKVSNYGGRRFNVRLPLFPGYLFLRGNHDRVIQADRTRRLVRIIQVKDQRQISAELGSIEAALRQGAELGTSALIREGWVVRVRSGPFQGIQGIVQHRTKANRLNLQVELLGSAASMEIDGDLLEVLAQTRTTP